MSIGISDEHVELAASLRKWAAGLGGAETARTADGEAGARFDEAWKAIGEMGVATIGDDGGTALDQAVALEACAHELVPGPLLGPVVAGALLDDVPDGAVVGLSLDPGHAVVWDAPSATHLLVGDAEDRWFLVPAEAATVTPTQAIDLSRRYGSAEVDPSTGTPVPGLTRELVRRTAVTFGAAEASGVARWCLQTAVDYAKVREQFGKPIGGFQAVKHLCAEMLETAEAVTAAAWDVAGAASGDAEQWAYAADVAAATAFDGAVEVAKTCIQVLGGIGFTFEHDAHLYPAGRSPCGPCSATATPRPSGCWAVPSPAYAGGSRSTSRAGTSRSVARSGTTLPPSRPRTTGARRSWTPAT
jgi:3-oxochol-4-en-24-oyl-CoA dehydrogenase